MKFKTLQIVWHGKQPIFAAEFLSADLLATGGADKTIRVKRSLAKRWTRPAGAALEVGKSDDVGVGVSPEAELEVFAGSVNCLRRSPRGDLFASGGDSGELILWKRETENANGGASVNWKKSAFLRGHSDDVLDMAWSPDASCLATAALEGMTILWDVQRRTPKLRLSDHHHYVQGVAWDPMHQFLVTQGGDRRCKIYSRPTESCQKKETAVKSARQWRLSRTLFKTRPPSQEGEVEQSPKEFMFHDDTLPSFFRRLAWSPEGLRKLTGGSAASSHVAYLYGRGRWSTPAGCLPGIGEPFVAVRFCPVLFENVPKRDGDTLWSLPYTVVFACSTLHNVLVYTSQSLAPIAVLCGLHFSEITDLAWSDNGANLIVSSRDGYCSIVQFEEGDLGVALREAEITVSDSSVLDWFQTLKEVAEIVDVVPAKRHIQPQEAMADAKATGAVAGPPVRARRRITPVAVEALPMPASSEDTTARITALVSTQQSTTLLPVTSKEDPPAEKAEAPQKSLADLLAFTQHYVQDRFGS